MKFCSPRQFIAYVTIFAACIYVYSINMNRQEIKEVINSKYSTFQSLGAPLNATSAKPSRFSAQDQDMERRLTRISETCSKYKNTINEHSGKHSTSYYLLNRRKSVGFCMVAKAASTSFVTSFLVLVGHQEMLTEKYTLQHMLLRKLMPAVRPSADLTGITSFLTVRHPFDRILSAYRDKFCGKHDDDYNEVFKRFRRTYGLSIIKHYRKIVPENSFFSDVPTFSEFVDYLIGTPVNLYNDHWRPFYLICQTCEFHYDIIVQLETMDEDTDVLVERTGIPGLKPNIAHKTLDSHTINSTNRKKEKSVHKNVTIEFFSQISDKQLLKLYERYKIDFEMFNYDINAHLDITRKI